MPLLATLLSSISTSIYGLIAAIVGAQYATRITAVLALAAIYISCVTLFTSIVFPWLANLFSTQYGQLLGLLFPPISGSVIASLASYWSCTIGVKYVSGLTKMAVG